MTYKIKSMILGDYRKGFSLNKLSTDYGYPEGIIKRVIAPKTPTVTSAIISTIKNPDIEKEKSNNLINNLINNMPKLKQINTTKLKSPKMIEAGKKAYITRMKNKDVVLNIEKSLIHVELPETWGSIYNTYLEQTSVTTPTSYRFKDYLKNNYQIPQKL